MNTKQDLVAVAGIGLITANFWLGGARDTVSAGLFNGAAHPDQVASAHTSLKTAGAELLFVAVATLLAGMSDNAGTAMLSVIVALGVLWAIHHFSGS